jgi:hypothetical protein
VAGSDTGQPNVNLIGKSLFTTYLFPFEATAALLIIAVVGAVVLSRRPVVSDGPADELEVDTPLADAALADASGAATPGATDDRETPAPALGEVDA